MTWVLIIGAAWLVLGCLAALVIGRGIRLADRQEHTLPLLNFVVDPDATTVPQGLPVVTPETAAVVARRPLARVRSKISRSRDRQPPLVPERPVDDVAPAQRAWPPPVASQTVRTPHDSHR